MEIVKSSRNRVQQGDSLKPQTLELREIGKEGEVQPGGGS